MLGRAIVGASHTGDKRMSVGKLMRIAYTRQIEIVPATFISTLCESRLPFPKTITATRRPTRLNEAHPDAVRKPPDEAMSLDLRVDGLVKAIACDQIANA